jgi:enoyl-CoA hydratase/carnithine racemase
MATETLTTMTLEQPLDGVLVATLNRPDRLNAMTDQMFEEFEQLALTRQRSELGALVMTGAGRAFCAGFDLDDADELSSLSPLGMLAKQQRAARALAALRGLPFPVIAAINGPATGGGLALALAADSASAHPPRASAPRSSASGCRLTTSAPHGCCRG